MGNSGTLEQWQEFITQYEQNLTTVKQHVDTVLNSSTATTAEKEQALSDYAEQKRYLDWLKAKYAEYESTGEVPADMTIDEDFSGDLYRYNGEIKIAEIPLDTTATPEIYHTIATVPRGTTQEFTIFQSEDLTLVVSVTAYQYNDVTVQYKTQSGNYPALIIYAEGTNDMVVTATGAWVTATGYTPNAPGYDSRHFYAFGYIYPPGSLSNVPTWGSSTSGLWGVKGFTPSGSDNPTRWIAVGVVSLSINGTVDNPWDFYNDNLLPDDPENAVFPEGYNPDPEKPDPDLPDTPGEQEHTGADVEPNDTTGIGGGFGFFTQYALRGSDISAIGNVLWAGFAQTGTQLDDYLANFQYRVSGSTGSVNYSDIIEFFVSLRMYPFPLGNVVAISPAGTDLYIGAGTEPLPMPNIIHTMDSYIGVLSAGSVTIPFWYRDYRDYDTKIVLYLPYCGTAELDPIDVMGATLDCTYYVDFCTGGCCAQVIATTWDSNVYPVAMLSGQIGADVPMSATNAGRVASRIMGDRINVAENIVSVLQNGARGIGAIMSGNVGGALNSGFSAFINPALENEKQLNNMMARGAISAPVLGSAGGFSAFCNPATAYVQVRSPFYPDIDNYPDSVGDPAAKTVVIGECTGFCQFVNVDLSGITADASDIAAIRAALSAGVYV